MNGKTPEQLYRERLKRVKDAISLKEPDRIPIVSPIQKFVYDYAGVTMKEAMYDYNKAKMACKKFLYEFQQIWILDHCLPTQEKF